ncbi:MULTISPECIES: hypothetical protein [Citrobacter]|uniref:hypothetical protein n=1 Tax=Citrobacter TaxID=544 RepID=UPI000F8EC9A6|nr:MULTISPECIES: hypothetical protein [Citrobacter]EHU7374541.1 hypothetical protein [Citrobacter freundii]MDM2814453.1 hypothetical protein [Citrobacter sp. Cpo103]MEB0789081.1 hypothetical protein [Citrobacter portucalensis]MEB0875736.1 hypothetical protein [Citrobacter portucalensis]RUR47130.1 hypothetical protein EKO26_07825 [Citrobacter portucalensis]
MKPTYEELERQLEESRREFRSSDATIHNLELKLTDMAVQLANAESKCRELAADNSAIKVMNDCLSEELRGYESNGAFDGPKMHLLWWKAETPATDAFLAEVRAQGVDALAQTLEGLVAVSVTRSYIMEFAAQLRKGAAL